MKKYLISICVTIMLLSSGCSVSPFSPRNNNKINNSNGEIQDIKNNQNGFMLDLAELRNKMDLVARDIDNMQQGFMNSNNKNYGVQIFQGEGGLLMAVALLVGGIVIVFMYRNEAIKYKKTAEILGKEIKSLKDINLENKIFTLAIKENIEKNVYESLKN